MHDPDTHPLRVRGGLVRSLSRGNRRTNSSVDEFLEQLTKAQIHKLIGNLLASCCKLTNHVVLNN